MAKQISVGVIGLQGFGSSYFGTFKKRPDIRLLAVCDLDAAAVDKAATTNGAAHRFTNYKDLLALADLDAVFIATPHFLHHPMAMDALRAGKHVFCEKPLAIRSEHAEEMARTARQRGLVLSCHYNQRQSSYVKTLRHIVSSGMIGEVYEINARWMARWTGFMFDARTNWRLQSEKSGGGIFIGRGSHLIDSVQYILGGRPVRSISATMQSRLTSGEVDDFATATLRFDGGLAVHIQCSYVAHIANFKDRMEYEIYGTRGGAGYGPGEDGNNTLRVGRCSMKDGSWEDLTSTLDLPAISNSGPASIIDDFLDAVAGGREPLVTGEEAAEVTRILSAGYESARTGKEIQIQPASTK